MAQTLGSWRGKQAAAKGIKRACCVAPPPRDRYLKRILTGLYGRFAASVCLLCAVLSLLGSAAWGITDHAGWISAPGTGTAWSSESIQSTTGSAAHTISGQVFDAESGENVVGAAIYAPYLELGAITNQYGFFSLTVQADTVSLIISHIAYAPQPHYMVLGADTLLNVALQSATVGLDEVEVVASRGDTPVEAVLMSQVNLPIAQIKAIPALLGEVDILKVVQLLPGVQSGKEGSSGLYVRGGGPDQNLILLDGITVYNASHLFGFLSTFNGDAVKDVSLIKGGFPARYGGRLSSVIDLTMKEGNLKEHKGSASVGIVASTVTVEGPIRKNRASFLVSARRTYLDLLVYPFLPKSQKGGYYFYDVNAKTNAILSDRDRVYVGVYAGHDRGFGRRRTDDSFTIQRKSDDFGWRNVTATARWNRILSPKLFANVLLGFTRFRLRTRSEQSTKLVDDPDASTSLYLSNFLSGITDGIGRADFEFAPGPSHYARFGVIGVLHTYHTGALTRRQSGPDIIPVDTLFTPTRITRSVELSAYVEDELRLTPQMKINAGIHASSFLVEGSRYASVQPRISLWWGLTGTTALKASYASMQQYIHLLPSASGLSLPTDLWVPATDRVRPQEANQVALGLAKTLRGGRYEITIESYYKRMRHLIEYKEGADYLGAALGSWQDKIENGRGWSYGAEFFLQKQLGRTTGWLGYTLSRTQRKFAELNDGNTFPYTYDRRHDVSLVVNHRLRASVELSGTWVYGTGQSIWLPIGQFYGVDHNTGEYSLGPWGQQTLRLYGPRNGSRMPSHHRLDMAVRLHRSGRRFTRTWSFGLYNAYSRRNPFILTATPERDYEPSHLVFKKITIFPIIPFATFRLEW